MTLTVGFLVPRTSRFRRILKFPSILIVGIVVCCGAGSVAKVSAETIHANNPRLFESSYQGRATQSDSMKTGMEPSLQVTWGWQKKRDDHEVVGEREGELVEADPLYKPRVVPPHAVLTSANSFLAGNPQTFSDLYFDENRSLMGDKKSGTLEEVADILRNEPESTLLVDAYCDERGAAAYSLMLGDRRAHQVQTYFMHLGLPLDRISSLSYGEEKIWCREQHAQCWEANLLLKGIFRLMAPRDPLNGCLVRLAMIGGSHRFSSPSQIRPKSPLQRLRLAHSP